MSDQYQILIDRDERREKILAALRNATTFGRVYLGNGTSDVLLLKSEIADILKCYEGFGR